MTYFALYRSSTTRRGCRKQFLSTEHGSTAEFHTSVSYPCELCGDVHAFAFSRTMMANTPSQRRSLTEWCTRQGVEMGIELKKLS
jgi:hypothetical protein